MVKLKKIIVKFREKNKRKQNPPSRHSGRRVFHPEEKNSGHRFRDNVDMIHDPALTDPGRIGKKEVPL